MQFVEAFSKSGYKIAAQRSDWSAERADGICISIWKALVDWKVLSLDTRISDTDLEDWGYKPGNRKRIRHAARALREFDGWIDAVMIDGVPGGNYGSAIPWTPSERQGLRWRIVYLDEETGHIRIEAQLPSP